MLPGMSVRQQGQGSEVQFQKAVHLIPHSLTHKALFWCAPLQPSACHLEFIPSGLETSDTASSKEPPLVSLKRSGAVLDPGPMYLPLNGLINPRLSMFV